MPIHNPLYYWMLFPIKEIWRPLIDGRLHRAEGGWGKYEEREEGCVKDLHDGLAKALLNIEAPLSEEFILDLHYVCTKNTKNLISSPGSLRKASSISASFGLECGETLTEQGLCEILNKMEEEAHYFKDFPHQHGSYLFIRDNEEKMHLLGDNSISNKNLKKVRERYGVTDNSALAHILFQEIEQGTKPYRYAAPSAGHVKRALRKLIKDYNAKIKTAQSDDDKLRVIIQLITDIDRLHPFADGNIRTFAILLLNRLLAQNGFPPVTFKDPNIFDGCSQAQLFAEVKLAIQNSMDIITGKKDSFGFKTSDIPEEDQKKYHEIVKNFKTLITTGHLDSRLLGVRRQDAEPTSFKRVLLDHVRTKDQMIKAINNHIETLEDEIAERQEFIDQCKAAPSSRFSFFQGYRRAKAEENLNIQKIKQEALIHLKRYLTYSDEEDRTLPNLCLTAFALKFDEPHISTDYTADLFNRCVYLGLIRGIGLAPTI